MTIFDFLSGGHDGLMAFCHLGILKFEFFTAYSIHRANTHQHIEIVQKAFTYHIFLPRDALLSAAYAVVVCLCVCLSHSVLYQNG